jgi:hypothetical protein
MVRGNAARRKELAALRRQDRKDEVARKKGGASRATPIEARARILAFCAEARRRGQEDSARAWVVAKDGSKKDVCEAWWRHGECESKRCRLSHESTLAHLAGMPLGSAVGGAASDGGSGGKKKSGRRQKDHAALPPMVCVPLAEVQAGGKLRYDAKVRTQRRQKSDLLFVEVCGALVFDKFNSSVFALWAAATTTAASLSSPPLPPLPPPPPSSERSEDDNAASAAAAAEMEGLEAVVE